MEMRWASVCEVPGPGSYRPCFSKQPSSNTSVHVTGAPTRMSPSSAAAVSVSGSVSLLTYAATALQRQPTVGSVTVSDFGELAAFTTMWNVTLPQVNRSAVYTPDDVCVILRVMPLAEVTEAVLPVALNV